MNHYSKEDLDRYLHKDVNFMTRQKIKKHLSGCVACTKTFNELKEDDNLLKEIRNSFQEANPIDSIDDKTYTNLSSILGKPQIGSSIA